MELHYARLYFTFTLKTDLPAPHGFFASRSEFESAFRKSLSCHRGDCAGCPAGNVCPFPPTFGQRIADDPEAVRRHQKPPLPFIFGFPLLPPVPNRGCRLELSLALVGSAVHHVFDYLSAVTYLIEAKGGELLQVEVESPGGGRVVVTATEHPALPLLGSLDPYSAGPLATDTVTMTLVTPLKLVHEGRLLKEFTFANFARSLMRRVSSLAYHYEGTEPPLDYRWLSQLSESVEMLESDCRFVSWGGFPAGILGTATFGGELEPFHLLLQVGMTTHVGKGASFGFGAFHVES